MFNTEQTSLQLLNEYRADLTDVTIKSLTNRESETARILMEAGERTELGLPLIVESESGNKYISVLTLRRNTPDWDSQWQIALYHIGLLPTPKGAFGLMFYPDVNVTLKLSPHFFERYRERLLKLNDDEINADLSSDSIIDTMSVFIRRNPNVTWMETSSVFKNRTHIFAPVNDGVVLMQWDSTRQLLQANTFVTYDMLNDEQLKMVGYTIKYTNLSEEERQQYQAPKFIT